MDSGRLNNGLIPTSAVQGDAEVDRTTNSRKKGQGTNSSNAAQPQYSTAVAPQRSCVECGATQTPQWREGPQGGVRHSGLTAAANSSFGGQLWEQGS